MRVLWPKGRLHIVEPAPYGSMTEVLKIVEDETHVRLETAKNVEKFAASNSATLLSTFDYEPTRKFRDFGEFVDRICNANPERLSRLPTVQSKMEQTFFQQAEEEDGMFILRQPCRAVHLAI